MSDETNTPANGSPAAPVGLMSNDALLAEMDALGDELPIGEPAKAKAAKVEAKDAKSGGGDSAGGGDDSEASADEGDADSAGGDASGASDEADAGDEDAEVEEGADAEAEQTDGDKPDPVAAKRIESIQKAEKESKERLAQERADAERVLQDRHREWESQYRPRLEKAAKVEKLVERADIDPVAFADERGWSKEQKLHVAEQLFLDAKADEDPKYRTQRAQRMRERETASKATSLEKELADTKSAMEEMRAEWRMDKDAGKAIALINDKTPALKHLLSTDKEFAEETVRNAINYIRKATGQYPDVADVIARLEEVEDREQKRRGVRRSAAPAAKAAPTKTKTQDAGESKTAKTAAVKNNKSPPPTAPPPTRDQLLKELEELDRN